MTDEKGEGGSKPSPGGPMDFSVDQPSMKFILNAMHADLPSYEDAIATTCASKSEGGDGRIISSRMNTGSTH